MSDAARPKQFTGPSAWVGAELQADPDAWLYHLTREEIADLEQAANHYLSLGRDIGEITKEAFPLTIFNNRINAAARNRHSHRVGPLTRVKIDRFR